MAGIQMIHIPYKGTAPAIADIMGGHADLTFSDPSVLPQLQAGRLKVIGVSGTKRYPPLPNAPTLRPPRPWSIAPPVGFSPAGPLRTSKS